mmetsp:Transcript_14953/g.40783  ORF Transcript_14953/g.40783 Transcript_14953/m.40783 type:complete len:126 (+) Transcript_14953:257-634(+)
MVKWRRLLTVSASAKLAGITTLCAMAPAVYRQIQRPSHEGFLWCMACVSTSFFLFSFQVHEKSILLPAMPISLLCLRAPKLATRVRGFIHFALRRRGRSGKVKAGARSKSQKEGVAAPGLDTLPG